MTFDTNVSTYFLDLCSSCSPLVFFPPKCSFLVDSFPVFSPSPFPTLPSFFS